MTNKLYRCTCGWETDDFGTMKEHPDVPGNIPHAVSLNPLYRSDNIEPAPIPASPKTGFDYTYGSPNVSSSFKKFCYEMAANIAAREVDPLTDPSDDFYRSPSER